jgi:glycosyltransferase involved in cell wall biosynthesis
MKRINYPLISFIIMTYNDAEGLLKCLLSLEMQEYPVNRMEIIVVDDGSSDNTVEIAKKHHCRVLINGTHDMYRSWGMGLHAMRGEYTYLLEQDIELRGNTFLKQMITPLLLDPSLAGSFTRKYPRRDQSLTNQFIAHHPAQCDPLYEFFSPSIESTFKEKREGYIMCGYSLGRIPPISRMMYRVKYLKKLPIWKDERFFDFETLCAMVNAGYTKYAYVPDAGIYHHHARSLSNLLSKRVRNLHSHYIKTDSKYKYTWFDVSTIGGILKIIVWIIYANLFIPALIRGIYRSIKYRNAVLLMEPIITITTTDVIIFSFIFNKDSRNYLFSLLGKFLKRTVRLAFQ